MHVFFLIIVMLATFVFAGEGTMNINGQFGVHKTQSAQTLGHGRLGVGLLMEAGGYGEMIEGEAFYWGNNRLGISNAMGINAYPFLSFGILDYFDVSVSIPLYGDYVKIDNPPDDLSAFGQGNLFISSKARAPIPEHLPFDVALLLGFGISTGKEDLGNLNDYGPWIRDPLFVSIADNTRPIADGSYSSYSNASSFFKVGGAFTFDFGRLSKPLPIMLHLNGSYRGALGEASGNYPKITNISAAIEWTPIPFLSPYIEYSRDMPSIWPADLDANLSTITGGAAIHFNERLDLQFGVQVFIGDAEAYMENLDINVANGGVKANYAARLIPKYLAYGGITYKFYTIVEEEVEEEEYRNPDTDEDVMCDPWVAETGRQREFTDLCGGIDLCPYEYGEIEDGGCPLEEEVSDRPVIKFNASQNLVQKGQSVTLSWEVENSTEVSIDNGVGKVSPSGSKNVKPQDNTTYTLHAIGDGGEQTASVDVEVSKGPVPTIMFEANTDTIQQGQSVTLKWNVKNASEVSIDNEIGIVKNTGSKKVQLEEGTVFIITATGEGGVTTSMVEVFVEAAPLPVIEFKATPESVTAGETATLSWTITEATEASIDNDIGKVQLKGSKKIKPTESTMYTLTAIGPGGAHAEAVELVVEEPVIEAKVNLKAVTFLSGKAELTKDAKEALDGIAEQLLAAPKVKIEIHGHTDNQGRAKANQELSERRAKAVVGYLAIKGVSTSRMKAIGFGADVPIADNKTKAGRDLNRRIEMIRVDE